jgi:hypothetical protein
LPKGLPVSSSPNKHQDDETAEALICDILEGGHDASCNEVDCQVAAGRATVQSLRIIAFGLEASNMPGRAEATIMVAQTLLVFAFVFAVIAALFITEVSRPPLAVNFGWLAVALYFLALVLGSFK